MRFALAFLLLLGTQESTLEKVAGEIARRVSAEPKDLDAIFDPAFFGAVPAEKITALLKDLHKSHGPVTSVVLISRDSDASGKFLFKFEKGTQSRVTLTINADGRVIGLYFDPVAKAFASVDEVIAEMKKLPGTVSFRAAKLGEKIETLHELNPDTALAIGSTFKLYILGTLVEDRRSWTEVLTLRAEWMSLPSGVMHTWPVGSPVTMHTLAAKMISISDNTATDHLLHHAGRERVEKMMRAMGNEHADRSTPFLGTLEMFKLKSGEGLRKKYLAADVEGRRALLAGAVREMPRDRATGWGAPLAIDTLEWFASAADLCRLMDWFRRKDDATAFGVLGINLGIDVPKLRFVYAGYKGGSEPGVLNLTWILKSKDGTWVAVSAGWNNPEKALDEKKFLGLIQALLYLL